jgi:hypothetical protein
MVVYASFLRLLYRRQTQGSSIILCSYFSRRHSVFRGEKHCMHGVGLGGAKVQLDELYIPR